MKKFYNSYLTYYPVKSTFAPTYKRNNIENYKQQLTKLTNVYALSLSDNKRWESFEENYKYIIFSISRTRLSSSCASC